MAETRHLQEREGGERRGKEKGEGGVVVSGVKGYVVLGLV